MNRTVDNKVKMPQLTPFPAFEIVFFNAAEEEPYMEEMIKVLVPVAARKVFNISKLLKSN